MNRLTVAIDGPAGAGKSSVAKRVARALGYTYIDTGAMYRAAALKCVKENIALENEDAVVDAARRLSIHFAPTEDGGQRVIADGEDVTDAIRSPEATKLSSPVSAIPGVRRVLVAQQQAMGAEGGVVMEGRDIGTVVFPSAQVKIYLTATDEVRAKRRWLELREKGEDHALAEILARQRERDLRDSSRADSPLKAANDAVILDTDLLTMEEVVQAVLRLCRERGGDA